LKLIKIEMTLHGEDDGGTIQDIDTRTDVLPWGSLFEK
jgi:hypothetical protein